MKRAFCKLLCETLYVKIELNSYAEPLIICQCIKLSTSGVADNCILHYMRIANYSISSPYTNTLTLKQTLNYKWGSVCRTTF